jgi:hypothetical protein
MFLCGQEEPLRANPYLYMLDEDTGRIELSETGHSRLSRYSFLWLGDRGGFGAAASALVERISSQVGRRRFWVSVWTYAEPGTLRTRSLLAFAKRSKEGWDIYHDETVAVASRPAEGAGTDGYRLPGYDWRDGHLALFLGEISSPEELLRGPAGATLRLFAERTPLAPSERFLSWLGDHALGVIYENTDHSGRPGLVAVCPDKSQIEQLLADGIVEEIRTGEAAPGVWSLPPVWPL